MRLKAKRSYGFELLRTNEGTYPLEMVKQLTSQFKLELGAGEIKNGLSCATFICFKSNKNQTRKMFQTKVKELFGRNCRIISVIYGDVEYPPAVENVIYKDF